MTDDRLQRLSDKQEIVEVLYRYARGWDRRDETVLRSCFHPDSQHAHGRFEGLSQDFITYGLESTRRVRSMTHLITNPLIELRGRKAVAECSFLAHHRRDAAEGSGEEDMFIKGRYLDVFEKRDDIWRIASRTGLSDFERIVPPAGTGPWPARPPGNWAGSNRTIRCTGCWRHSNKGRTRVTGNCGFVLDAGPAAECGIGSIF